MMALQEQYLTDREGNRVKVVLDMEQFQQMLEELEELDDIRAYDAAKASGDEATPFDQAMAEIRRPLAQFEGR
jgi:hypothetical protein